MSINYNRTTWRNDSAPPINAENLNKIEEAIVDVVDEVNNTPHYEFGKTAGTRVDGGSAVNVSVTFEKEFAEPPIVTATLFANSNNITQYANLQWSVHSVTTTGFVLRLYNANSSSYLQPALNWIAVGEKPNT